MPESEQPTSSEGPQVPAKDGGPHGAGTAPEGGVAGGPGRSEDVGQGTMASGHQAGGRLGGASVQQALASQASELAGNLSDRVVDAVAWLKARTTVRVVTVLRAIVYGLVALVALVTAAILATAGIVRIWDAYVPVHPVGMRVWLGYVVFGGAMFLGGALLMGQRRAARRRS